MVAMKDVKTVGLPSYTSGVQKWKGAAETLKDIEASKSTNPMPFMGEIIPMPALMPSRKKVPASPYKNAIPISMSPVEKEPIRKYFNAASFDLRFVLALPANT